MNFIPCLTWVKRGVSKEVPEKVNLSKPELRRLIEESITDIKDLNVNDNDEENEADHQMDGADGEDVVAKYGLDSYDDDQSAPSVFSLEQISDFTSEKEEPEEETVCDSDDEENFRIKPNDNLIAVGHVAEDCSTLEIYVYNEDDDDLYVHHDILLPAFPVCLEWLCYGPDDGTLNNYLAVGDMTPVINIWDLNTVDSMEPVGTLGKKLKKKEKKKITSSGDHGHVDAVLDLSWNKNLGHALASGSADHSVILWDLSSASPVTHLRHHNEKVQCVEWHPFEAEILLTGSCDKSVTLYDARAVEQKKSWTIPGEVEKVLWNHFDPFHFLVGCDQGNIYYFDVRTNQSVFTIDAHSKGISDMSLSSSCPGLLVSVGSFTSAKMWDIRNNQPKFVESQKLKQGNLLACRGSPDSPFTVAIGGDKPSSNFKVLKLLSIETVRNHFAAETMESRPVIDQEQASSSLFESASSSQPTMPSSTSELNPGTKKALKNKTMSKKKWK